MKRSHKMLWKKAGKTLTAFVLAACLMAAPLYTAAPVEAATLSELQDAQERLEKEQAENQAKLDAMKEDTSKQQEYKDTIDAQIKNLEEQIMGLYAQIRQMDTEIQAKNQEISGKQKSIDKNIEVLKERLCAMYMLGEASNLQLILSSENMMDMAEKTELIRMITEHDMNLVQILSEEMDSIADQKSEIEANREKVAAAKTELDEKMAEMEALQEEADRVLAELKAKEAEVQAEQDRINREKAAADRAVDAWFAEQAAKEEANKNPSSGGSSGGNSGYTGTGQFTWPTPGYTYLTDYFGTRGGSHAGIDISAYGIFGKPIVASDSGTVIFAQYGMPGSGYGGYGNVVVINHGNGYMTLYAHCNSLAVSYGQTVTKGQVVGYVGSTGWSTGPHLHFEIRKNGVPQNPMNWFS